MVFDMFFFFFFQAEDGIRDTSVTGVQTCALPIWSACEHGGCRGVGAPGRPTAPTPRQPPCSQADLRARPSRRPRRIRRSEERRVGKERRSRRGPQQQQTTKKRGEMTERDRDREQQ